MSVELIAQALKSEPILCPACKGEMPWVWRRIVRNKKCFIRCYDIVGGIPVEDVRFRNISHKLNKPQFFCGLCAENFNDPELFSLIKEVEERKQNVR